MGVRKLEYSKNKQNQQKVIEELQQENSQLKQEVQAMDAQLTSTQIALCDVYELLLEVNISG